MVTAEAGAQRQSSKTYSAARSTSVVITPAVPPRTMSLLLGSTIVSGLEYMTSKVAPGMRQETTSRSSEGHGTLMVPKRGAGPPR